MKKLPRLILASSTGFTLIELIVVMVILGILASIGIGFVVKVTDSYQAVQRRASIINSSRPALERMTRQLRDALPYSIRVVNSGSCIEFMPIAAGGNYLSAVSDDSNLGPLTSTIAVSPHSVNFGTARYVSIGALSADELYGSGSSRAGYSSGSTSTVVQLTSPKRWVRNSISRRFYLLDNPQAFCVVGSELRAYEGLNVADASVNLGASYSLLAKTVSAASPFQLVSSGENSNALVTMNITFVKDAESMNFTHRVMIRNVP